MIFAGHSPFPTRPDRPPTSRSEDVAHTLVTDLGSWGGAQLATPPRPNPATCPWPGSRCPSDALGRSRPTDRSRCFDPTGRTRIYRHHVTPERAGLGPVIGAHLAPRRYVVTTPALLSRSPSGGTGRDGRPWEPRPAPAASTDRQSGHPLQSGRKTGATPATKTQRWPFKRPVGGGRRGRRPRFSRWRCQPSWAAPPAPYTVTGDRNAYTSTPGRTQATPCHRSGPSARRS